MSEHISGFTCRREDLKVRGRRAGLSAFMRIRNGEEFLEATIRSHINFFDEIVAVYNQCTDGTPEILERLAGELGGKLKVYHYVDRVFPPGSEDHARTEGSSPQSLVNYYNTALALTTCQVATKLDDDHLAIPEGLGRVTRMVREMGAGLGAMYCFAGLNLMREAGGGLGIPREDPVSGGGDIGFFPVTEGTFFVHDRRFERFERGGLRREFAGFLYWHLKYMKRGMGFGNYELERYPGSRYARRREVMAGAGQRGLGLGELLGRKPGWGRRVAGWFSEKQRLLLQRERVMVSTFGGMTLEEAVERMSEAGARRMVLEGGGK
jgi:hypothetical protein